MEFGLLEMWQAMGLAARLVIVVLLLMSVYVIGVSLERQLRYRKGRKASDALLTLLRTELAERGTKLLDDVEQLTQTHARAPLAAVLSAAAGAFVRRGEQLDAMDLVIGINRAVERTIERQTSALKRGLGGLATIASTAPFVGLFGTVVGIINAFQSMAVTGTGGLASVSAGIAEALVATAMGLLVAIPAVGLYNYFTGVVDLFVVDMDEVSSEVVEAVLLERAGK